MSLTDTLVLSPEVLIIAVGDLPPAVREEIGDRGSFVLTQARARASSTLVDQATAALLQEFRSPATVEEAVIRYSRRMGLDPERTLDESYHALRGCFGQGVLVVAGSEQARRQVTRLSLGRRIAGGAVVRCIQLLEDTEIYQLALDDGGLGALKLLRPTRSAFAAGALGREVSMLARLDGQIAPRLLEVGEVDGDQWFAMEWCDGLPVNAVAAGLRRVPGRGGELLDLCRRVATTYGDLHELGVVHGDVHPGNVLVSPAGAVRLVDFGLGQVTDGSAPREPVPRGGVQAYLEPEYARAVLDGRPSPPGSAVGEQFSVAALLYELVTGSKHLDLSIENAGSLRQIAEDPPFPFTRRGLPPWPELESVLATALQKDPVRRFPSVTELARRLSDVAPPAAVTQSNAARGPSSVVDLVLASVLAKARPGGEWFEHGVPNSPFCSVVYGAAGLAAGLHRISVQLGDPDVLSLADEWVVRARREADRPLAFTSDVIEVTDEITGRVTPFHRMSGVHAVQALVSHGLGEPGSRQSALDAFVRECRQPCPNPDLTLGRSGVLLGATLLLEAIGGARYAELGDLVRLGNETFADLWAELDSLPPIAASTDIAYLGVAHGWAGLLLATLRWCRAAGAPRPANLVERLDQLAALAQPVGLGVRWPWTNHQDPRGSASTMPGWCNGTAGHVHLWVTAHAVLGDNRWGTLAERAGWDVYGTLSNIAQICCGLAGQAYALLELYRHTGERRWLTAATELAVRAAVAVDASGPDSLMPGSLHKGDVGVAVLAADLAEPETAAMPFFGRHS